MLIEFRLQNFRSYAAEQVFSFSAGSGRHHPEELLESPGLPRQRLLRTAALYGPNGAGKSALVRALDTLGRLVRDSAARLRPGDPLPVAPFRLDPARVSEPSGFEVSFIHPVRLDPEGPLQPIRLQFGCKVTAERIVEEWLYAFPHGPAQRWYSRENDTLRFGRSLTGERQRLAQQIAGRPNALALSMGAQLGHPLLVQIYGWFKDTLRVLGPGQRTTADEAGGNLRLFSGRRTARLALESDEAKARIVALLQRADTGIADLSIRRRARQPDDWPETLQVPDAVRSSWLAEPEYQVSTLHRHGTRRAQLSLAEESEGTQHLFCLAGPWLEAMETGQVLIVDDLMSNLHPLLARALIESRPPQSRGQVLLITHDTSLLDLELLRRDQFWFVEKSPETGASSLYSLEEFRPRNDKRLQRAYLKGELGALPLIERLAG